MINGISMPAITSSDTIMSRMHSIKYAEHPERVLVIGNGFDLGLGLQTTYRHFANSNYWPFNNTTLYPEGTLAHNLNVHRNLDRWFDLEENLYQYARKGRTYQTPNERVISDIKEFDFQSFQKLSDSLTAYLDNEQKNRPLNIDGTASHFLEIFCGKNIPTGIYSFNYTNLSFLSNRIGHLRQNLECTHIHGSLKSHNIILGVGDKREMRDNYFFLHKSAHPKFASNKLVMDLLYAKEVVIYGHSLGENDHDYFREFFHDSTKYDNKFAGERRKITIITRDESSKLDIKKQLMALTATSLISLFAHCDVNILCTDNDNEVSNFLCQYQNI